MSGELALDTVAQNQLGKELTVNAIFGEVEAAIAGIRNVDLTAANIELTVAQLQRCAVILLSAGVTGRTLTLDATKRVLNITNRTAFAVSITVGTTTASLPAGKATVVFLDGTANGLQVIGGGGSGGGGSLPTGGSAGQVLTKIDSTDGNADWETPTAGGGSGGLVPVHPPTTALFTYSANGTGVTQSVNATTKAYTLTRTDTGTGGGERAAFVGKAVPSGSSWTVTAIVKPGWRGGGYYYRTGVALHETASGKVLGLVFNTQNRAPQIALTRYASLSAYTSDVATEDTCGTPDFLWVKIEYATGTYTFSVSVDFGATWIVFGTQGAAAWFTTAADRVGLLAESYNSIPANNSLQTVCVYWDDPDFAA